MQYMVISDLHLGHKKVPIEQMIQHLDLYFREHIVKVKELDYIFIAGDIFDSLLATHSKEYVHTVRWLAKLFTVCKKYKIKIRVLEGTPSHDRRQMVALTEVFKVLELDGLDYLYVDELCVREEDGLKVLYIPDNYKPTGRDVENEIDRVLGNAGLEKVDIAIVHATFDYQLPIELACMISADYLSSKVKYAIHSGHIHSKSSRNKIICQGSFDRLTHAEEEEKGAVFCSIENGKFKYDFVPNKNSTYFKTFIVNKEEEKDVIELLKKEFLTVKEGEFWYVRLCVDNPSTFKLDRLLVHDLLPRLEVKIVKNKQEKVKDKLLPKVEFKHTERIEITPENIEKLLFESMKSSKEIPSSVEKKIIRDTIEQINKVLEGAET